MRRIGTTLGCSIIALAMIGCGGSDGSSEVTLGDNQYLLDVEAEFTYWVPAAAKVAANLPNRQVMIGTALVEVRQDALQELGVTILDLDLRTQDGDGPAIQLVLNPDSTSTGTFYTLCEILGIPTGTGFLNLNLAARARNTEVTILQSGSNAFASDGVSLGLGWQTATQDANDWRKISIPGDLPLIRFLFNSQEHRGRASDLIIHLTPQILSEDD